MVWIARLLRTKTGLLLAGGLVALACSTWIAARTAGADPGAAKASSLAAPMPVHARIASHVPDEQQFPVGGIDIQDAQQVAVGYWGWMPCGGVVTIQWSRLDRAVNARSTWWNPVAAYGNAQANSDCDVMLNSAQSYDWPMLCTVIVHEYGHLTGHPHVQDPSNVMFPVYLHPVSQCATPDPAAGAGDQGGGGGAPPPQPGAGGGSAGGKPTGGRPGRGGKGSGGGRSGQGGGKTGQGGSRSGQGGGKAPRPGHGRH